MYSFLYSIEWIPIIKILYETNDMIKEFERCKCDEISKSTWCWTMVWTTTVTVGKQKHDLKHVDPCDACNSRKTVNIPMQWNDLIAIKTIITTSLCKWKQQTKVVKKRFLLVPKHSWRSKKELGWFEMEKECNPMQFLALKQLYDLATEKILDP